MKGNRPLEEMFCFDGSIPSSGTYDCINRSLAPDSDSAAISYNIMLFADKTKVKQGTRISSK